MLSWISLSLSFPFMCDVLQMVWDLYVVVHEIRGGQTPEQFAAPIQSRSDIVHNTAVSWWKLSA